MVVILLMTLAIAPAKNIQNSGSTFNRAPDGYGAWYAFMSERGTPIQRWQKPFEDLANNPDAQPPIALLRVYPNLTTAFLSAKEREWVERGNVIVNLGVKEPATAAPFSTLHDRPTGNIKIDTTRRSQATINYPLLSDRFGGIVWAEKLEQGWVIFATTPHLAANAYQDFPGNYEFLAQLVTQSRVRVPAGQEVLEKTFNPSFKSTLIANHNLLTVSNSLAPKIFVDEYLHGYKAPDVIQREIGETILSYLAKTPLFPAFIQALILLTVAIVALNRRFGQPATLSTPVVDNSEAYIQALAGVLQKANSTDFTLEVLAKEEQLQLQKALFLGQVPLDSQSIIDAWVRQTGRPAAELEQLLQISAQKRRMSETELLMWLNKWQQIRSHLPSTQINREHERN